MANEASFDRDAFSHALRTRRMGRTLIARASVESTMDVAWDALAEGMPDGTAVVADQQTRGRGRGGRSWWMPPGRALAISLALHPGCDAREMGTLPLVAGLALAEALETLAASADSVPGTRLPGARLRARLKWPNDVLVNGRKLAGILLESRSVAEPVVVVGIGVNLRQRTFSPGLAETATSVDLEGGRAVGREELLEAVLAAFDRWRGALESAGFAPLRARWLAIAETIGRAVTVGEHAGIAVDLAEDGALVLRHGAGLQRVFAGEVTTSRAG